VGAGSGSELGYGIGRIAVGHAPGHQERTMKSSRRMPLTLHGARPPRAAAIARLRPIRAAQIGTADRPASEGHREGIDVDGAVALDVRPGSWD
jgi:hypothetical protein